MKEHPDYKYRPRRKPKPSAVHTSNKCHKAEPKFPFANLSSSMIRAMDSLAARAAAAAAVSVNPFFPPTHHHHSTGSGGAPPVVSSPATAISPLCLSTSSPSQGRSHFSGDFSRIFHPANHFLPSSLSAEAILSRLAMGGSFDSSSDSRFPSLVPTKETNGGSTHSSSPSSTTPHFIRHGTTYSSTPVDNGHRSSNNHDDVSSSSGSIGNNSNGRSIHNNTGDRSDSPYRLSPKHSASNNNKEQCSSNSRSPSPHSTPSSTLASSHYVNGYSGIYPGFYPHPYLNYPGLSHFLPPGATGTLGQVDNHIHPHGFASFFDPHHHSSHHGSSSANGGTNSLPKRSPVYVVYKPDSEGRKRTPSPTVSVV